MVGLSTRAGPTLRQKMAPSRAGCWRAQSLATDLHGGVLSHYDVGRGKIMPTISMFFGIIIRMYMGEERAESAAHPCLLLR